LADGLIAELGIEEVLEVEKWNFVLFEAMLMGETAIGK
jgi:hypothetical protein